MTEWANIPGADERLLPQRAAAEFARPRGVGINRPVELYCDDDKHYMVKGVQVGKPLVCEVFVSVLGAMLGAPIADACIVDVPFGFIEIVNLGVRNYSGDPAMATWKAGPAFGSHMFSPEYEQGPCGEYAELQENRRRYALLAVLFGWIGGHEAEYLYHRTDQSVVSIDFDHFIGERKQGWSLADLTAPHEPTLEPELAPLNFTPDELAPHIEALGAVSDRSLASGIATCPDQWTITEQERVALYDYLRARRDVLIATAA